jgi:hypothetical protein
MFYFVKNKTFTMKYNKMRKKEKNRKKKPRHRKRRGKTTTMREKK